MRWVRKVSDATSRAGTYLLSLFLSAMLRVAGVLKGPDEYDPDDEPDI